jgi:hypothetical protein
MAEPHDEGGGSVFGSPAARVGGIAVLLVLAVVAARARAAGAAPHVAGPPGEFVLGMIRSLGLAVLVAGVVLLAWAHRLRKVQRLSRVAKKKTVVADQRKRVWAAVLIGIAVAFAYQIVMQLISPNKARKEGQGSPPSGPIQDGHGWVDRMTPHYAGEAGIGTYFAVVGMIVTLVVLGYILMKKADIIKVYEDEDEDEELKQVTGAIEAGRAAVRDESILDPRQAIVACFAAMERALARFGGDVAPREADTPEEVLRRGVTGARLPEQPARRLLRLFREARFSPHPMVQEDREAANQALDEMLTAIGAAKERSW